MKLAWSDASLKATRGFDGKERYEIRNIGIEGLARQAYVREGAAVVAGDAVGLASVCQVGDVVTALRLSKLGRPRSLRRLTVDSNGSKPGIASLVVDVSKNSPALIGVAELLVWLVTVLDDSCWLPFAA
jgi:hypothetical protein